MGGITYPAEIASELGRIVRAARALVNHDLPGESGFGTCPECADLDGEPCDVWGCLWRDLREAVAAHDKPPSHSASADEYRMCLKCGFKGHGWWSTPNGRHHGLHMKPGTEVECGYFAQVVTMPADDAGTGPVLANHSPERFLRSAVTSAFDLLFQAQYIGAWTIDQIEDWTRLAGDFCTRYEHVARTGLQERREQRFGPAPDVSADVLPDGRIPDLNDPADRLRVALQDGYDRVGSSNLMQVTVSADDLAMVLATVPSAGDTDWKTIAHALAMEFIEARAKLRRLNYNINRNGHPHSVALSLYNEATDTEETDAS